MSVPGDAIAMDMRTLRRARAAIELDQRLLAEHQRSVSDRLRLLGGALAERDPDEVNAICQKIEDASPRRPVTRGGAITSSLEGTDPAARVREIEVLHNKLIGELDALEDVGTSSGG